MAKAKTASQTNVRPPLRPAISPENRENQLTNLAYDLVEQRLRDGTATSQETTYFLKLGSSKYKYENEKLKEENKLLRAKTEAIESNKDMKETYEKALKAMQLYQGHGDDDDEYDEYEDY